jgi:hypothetical protein
VAHAPAPQTCPAAHALPQAPQLARSLWRSRQTPAHSLVPATQETRHAPPSQTCPEAHALPQAPQFSRSLRVLAQ